MGNRIIVLTALVALGAACAHMTRPEAERLAILKADQAWLAAVAAKDVEGTLSFWTDDAMVFAPGQPVIAGKEALRQFVKQSFDLPGFSITWETHEVNLSPHGDFAYALGTNELRVPGPDGKLMTIRGRGVTVWRKEPDGAWKCVIDIWNDQPSQM